VASAAEYSARVWQVRDGTLLGEIPVNGAATALAFSSGGESLAVGDVAGNVFYGAPRGSDPWRSVRMPSTVVAAAFEPQSRWIATGDDTGRVQLWDSQSARPMGDAWVFEHPVTWLSFSGDGLYLAARSGHWVHRLRVDETGLTVTRSRFVTSGLDSDAVLTSPDASSIRIVGGHATGRPDVLDVDLDVAGIAAGRVEPGQFQRDWPTVLGLELDPSTGLVRNSP
jgi:WD40 repeat protein